MYIGNLKKMDGQIYSELTQNVENQTCSNLKSLQTFIYKFYSRVMMKPKHRRTLEKIEKIFKDTHNRTVRFYSVGGVSRKFFEVMCGRSDTFSVNDFDYIVIGLTIDEMCKGGLLHNVLVEAQLGSISTTKDDNDISHGTTKMNLTGDTDQNGAPYDITIGRIEKSGGNIFFDIQFDNDGEILDTPQNHTRLNVLNEQLKALGNSSLPTNIDEYVKKVLELDCLRRDFTINTIVERDGKIIGKNSKTGKDDIIKAVISFCGNNPNTRVKESHERLLRLLRFLATGYRLQDEESFNKMITEWLSKKDVLKIAPNNLIALLLKIFENGHPCNFLHVFKEAEKWGLWSKLGLKLDVDALYALVEQSERAGPYSFLSTLVGDDLTKMKGLSNQEKKLLECLLKIKKIGDNTAELVKFVHGLDPQQENVIRLLKKQKVFSFDEVKTKFPERMEFSSARTVINKRLRKICSDVHITQITNYLVNSYIESYVNGSNLSPETFVKKWIDSNMDKVLALIKLFKVEQEATEVRNKNPVLIKQHLLECNLSKLRSRLNCVTSGWRPPLSAEKKKQNKKRGKDVDVPYESFSIVDLQKEIDDISEDLPGVYEESKSIENPSVKLLIKINDLKKELQDALN
jgi:tRNA nucleotidyltransferase/poly(A) polymerase